MFTCSNVDQFRRRSMGRVWRKMWTQCKANVAGIGPTLSQHLDFLNPVLHHLIDTWRAWLIRAERALSSPGTKSEVTKSQQRSDLPLQSQKAVTAHFKSEQLLPFGFAGGDLGRRAVDPNSGKHGRGAKARSGNFWHNWSGWVGSGRVESGPLRPNQLASTPPLPLVSSARWPPVFHVRQLEPLPSGLPVFLPRPRGHGSRSWQSCVASKGFVLWGLYP